MPSSNSVLDVLIKAGTRFKGYGAYMFDVLVNE